MPLRLSLKPSRCLCTVEIPVLPCETARVGRGIGFALPAMRPRVARSSFNASPPSSDSSQPCMRRFNGSTASKLASSRPNSGPSSHDGRRNGSKRFSSQSSLRRARYTPRACRSRPEGCEARCLGSAAGSLALPLDRRGQQVVQLVQQLHPAADTLGPLSLGVGFASSAPIRTRTHGKSASIGGLLSQQDCASRLTGPQKLSRVVKTRPKLKMARDNVLGDAGANHRSQSKPESPEGQVPQHAQIIHISPGG